MGFNVGFNLDTLIPQNTNTSGNTATNITGSGKQTTYKTVSQASLDKIISDVLGSDQGIAALAQGENVSGGFGSTAKTQLAQDLITKLVGEIATITAPTTVSTEQNQQQQAVTKQSSKKSVTVICTELLNQGKFPSELYYHPKALAHFMNLPDETVSGYHFWAMKVVEWMKKSPRLCAFLRPIVLARYIQIVYGQSSILGSATIYVGQPVCYLIGHAVKFFSKESDHGIANT